MGYSLLATSYNMLVTFIIFRDMLCGTLKQGDLGNALCKDSRNVHLLSFQLFIFLSVISGFYAVFIFFLLTYFPLCSFPTYIFSFLPPSLSDFLVSVRYFTSMFSSSCSACTHSVEQHQSAGILWVYIFLWFAQPTAKYLLWAFTPVKDLRAKRMTGEGKWVTGNCWCCII